MLQRISNWYQLSNKSMINKDTNKFNKKFTIPYNNIMELFTGQSTIRINDRKFKKIKSYLRLNRIE